MRLFFLIAASIFAMPAIAHEFWISPQTYNIEPEGQIVAQLRVGENFKGAGYSYLPRNFERFDLVLGDTIFPVDGRIGDRPALTAEPPGEGLVRIVHQTTDMFLTYRDAAKFESFVTKKDFAWALKDHTARGLPETGFRERYSRYGKSLVAVGAGGGEDAPVGLETEIVALTNPYTHDLSNGMSVKILYQGAPRADTQVMLFEKAPDGTVSKTIHRSDAEGVATLPVQPGHEYLADAVVMRPLTPIAENDPVWESLWASLTFRVPD